ncbi:helix-turn-helix domain-containing protein [Bacillus sp. BRMEA1]|uniref:helix-turn-helix domain-containing protein n=1 Tax=Neobacillus endophyticus TaxID=2738405 RepID=UPI001563CBCC|nr:helix-turn-helix domain-containing protein [Neobacillus endophyticus]NRD80339.1 helix-turn-helix domain-containing protein [Neobacillus endophyticus]
MEKNFILPPVLTALDIQNFLNISKGKAYELFKEDGFPTIIIGGNKRVYREEFLNWIDSKKIN